MAKASSKKGLARVLAGTAHVRCSSLVNPWSARRKVVVQVQVGVYLRVGGA